MSKRKRPAPQIGFDFDASPIVIASREEPEKRLIKLSESDVTHRASPCNSRPAEAPREPVSYIPSLEELLRKSVGAPLKSRQWRKGDPGDPEGNITKFDTFAEPKFGHPLPQPSQVTSIEAIGAETRAIYIKLAIRDGDWRAWHRHWPNVKPNAQMMNLFVIGRAKFLEAERAG